MNKRLVRGHLSRRDFLKRTAISAGLVAAPNIITSAALGAAGRASANSRINVGVIGVGGRGRDDMRAFLAQPDTQVVAVCDVNCERKEGAANMVNQRYGNQDCAQYIDMMELLDRKDIDAVLIATGDNWHSGASVVAARAGKDIYCEKPLSVCINESRAVADTVKRTGRVFQCGTQRRSLGNFRFAIDLARSGKLGQLKEMLAEEAPWFPDFNYEILPEEPEPPREVFDWSGWLGPAQWRPYNAKYPTRQYWSDHVDFSGASITEWGSHTADLCQWANNADDTSPIEYWKEGENYVAKYANGVKLSFVKGLRFGSCPIKLIGDEGWVETGDSGQVETFPKSLAGNRGFEGGYPQDNHVRAFLDCIYTRETPASSAEASHRSITACHVANICKRLGRPMKWDPATEQIVDDEEANRLCSRAYREPWYL
ncbi:MAG: hypothetical protein AMXMBFR4_07940 [Candidatus Hydrogenedentota bacterium]